MKNSRLLVYLCFLFIPVLLACALPFWPQAAPVETQPTILPPATTATLAPVDLLGPEPAAGTMLRWYDGSTLVYVPSGPFLMGHGGQDNPEHTVSLNGFWIYRTKVTNDMYARCVAAGKCTPPGPDAGLPDYTDPLLKDNPVVGIKWDQAVSYCGWTEARLPTEAEWEKTARGPNGKLYPWGDAQPTCSLANHASCVGRLTNVLAYPEGMSEYKAFDFSGNAFEWVADWYKATYYSESPTDNPTGPEIGDVRSVRGSTFASPADQVLPSTRYFLEPQNFRPDLGFRCVVENPQDFAPPCDISPIVGEPATGPGGGSPGGSTSCEPPPLSVTVTTYCQKKIPYANVDLNGATNLDLAGGDCSPAGDLFVCTGSDNETYHMTACTTCEPPTPEPGTSAPSCPSGYTYDAAGCSCKYSATGTSTGTNCPTTFAALYMPALQCCQVQSGVASSAAAPSCDPGYIPSGCTCVSGAPGETAPVQSCDEFTVSLPDCTREQGCSGCSCYGNPRECIAAGCSWDKQSSSCR